MKTLVCLIAVLVITAPVLAQTTVTIVGDTSVPGELTLKYYVSPDTAALRGVALTLNSGAATTNAAGTTAGANWNVCLDYAYDRMTAEPPESYSLGEGTPLANFDGPGVPADDVSDFSICVGYVDEGGLQGGVLPGSPGAPEDLCTIVLTGLPATVTVAGDTLRGGAVGSPVDIVFDLDGNGTPGDDTIDVPGGDCFVGNVDETAAWNAWGQPENWCDSCWRCGDVNSSGDVTTADYLQVWNDLIGGDTTGRSDVNMSGDLTTADYLLVWNKLKAGLGCTPCE